MGITCFHRKLVISIFGIFSPKNRLSLNFKPKIVSEYDQEIPQSQTADTVAPRGRAAQPSRDTRKTN